MSTRSVWTREHGGTQWENVNYPGWTVVDIKGGYDIYHEDGYETTRCLWRQVEEFILSEYACNLVVEDDSTG